MQEKIKSLIDNYKEFSGIGKTLNGYLILLSKDSDEIRDILKKNFPDTNFEIRVIGDITFQSAY